MIDPPRFNAMLGNLGQLRALLDGITPDSADHDKAERILDAVELGIARAVLAARVLNPQLLLPGNERPTR